MLLMISSFFYTYNYYLRKEIINTSNIINNLFRFSICQKHASFSYKIFVLQKLDTKTAILLTTDWAINYFYN